MCRGAINLSFVHWGLLRGILRDIKKGVVYYRTLGDIIFLNFQMTVTWKLSDKHMHPSEMITGQ